MSPAAAPLLAAIGVSKAFPGVHALRAVDFEVHAGEVHALVGENGAGKSTLIKILAGAEQPDAGALRLDGRPIELRSPQDGLAAGISVIYQELNLVPALSVGQNIFLGREITRLGWLDRRSMMAQSRRLLGDLGMTMDPGATVRTLGVAERQMVEIAKAISRSARVLIMDEPSAPLTGSEIQILFRLIRRLQAQGVGVVYISHRLDEVFAIADRVTVLRDGARILTEPMAACDLSRLVFAMVGRHLGEEDAAASTASESSVVLAAHHLADGERVRDVSLTLRSGEIVGLAGPMGAGRTELAHLLFGARAATAGSVHLLGQDVTRLPVRERIRAGIGMVPEDRKLQGLVLSLMVRDNATLATLERYGRCGLISRRRQEDSVGQHLRRLRIHARGPRDFVRTLSGGNQQKVILARWLETGARALLLDEPTRGVDVGAKREIYALIRGLRNAGSAILVISSDLPELLRLSDRVVVLRDGRTVAELDRATATQESVLHLMVAAGRDSPSQKEGTS